VKELKFIHITKTAGTSIENAGFKNGKMWGRFHEAYGWWHTFFPLLPNEIKQKYDWFLVVRNPYARIVSEFYCRWTDTPKKTKDISVFNDVVKKQIENRSKSGDHWAEQYKYIEHNCRIHILKYESLDFDFDSLMKYYNLNVELSFCNRSKKIFGPLDLSKKTLNLINDVYREDFEYFNYKMLTKLDHAC